MSYRLKNISNQYFRFEGIEIGPGEISEELTSEVYQRLLALYWHRPLEPVEDVVETIEQSEEVVKSEEVVEQPEIVEWAEAEKLKEKEKKKGRGRSKKK